MKNNKQNYVCVCDVHRYLIENAADVAAVNNDGELPIDIAETEAMEELLDKETHDRGMSSYTYSHLPLLV